MHSTRAWRCKKRLYQVRSFWRTWFVSHCKAITRPCTQSKLLSTFVGAAKHLRIKTSNEKEWKVVFTIGAIYKYALRALLPRKHGHYNFQSSNSCNRSIHFWKVYIYFFWGHTSCLINREGCWLWLPKGKTKLLSILLIWCDTISVQDDLATGHNTNWHCKWQDYPAIFAKNW